METPVLTCLVLEQTAVSQADQRAGHTILAGQAVLVHQHVDRGPGHGQHRTATNLGR